jgi:two-component system alkaline phosphatase synthesis response regulator PhoP/two-component system response regulator VicR
MVFEAAGMRIQSAVVPDQWHGREDQVRKRIVAVDDQRDIARLVRHHLELAGYEVTLAYDGAEALEKVRESRPDLVILDVMLPKLSGFEVLRQLKEDPETEPIPVIMLTAKSEADDALQGYERGAQWYLSKPFDPEELLTFVQNVLGPFSTLEGDAPSSAPAGAEG